MAKTPERMTQGKQQPKIREIRALGSEITAPRTDDERRTNFDFMSSADIVKQS